MKNILYPFLVFSKTFCSYSQFSEALKALESKPGYQKNQTLFWMQILLKNLAPLMDTSRIENLFNCLHLLTHDELHTISSRGLVNSP